jgi:5-methylthioadenosine/S-adenosylhomocysteine deaminase
MEFIETGFLAIREGRIEQAGDLKELPQNYQAKEIRDARGCLVLPGLVNAHTHAAMTIFRGLADDLPLMTWLNNYIFPIEKRLTKDWVYWGTLLALCEMIASGTTAFGDMYLFAREVARAAQESGMRALVGEVLYDFPSPNYGLPEAGLIYTEELIREYQNNPLITVAVEPHALYTCSPDLLKKAKHLAQTYQAPLKTHLSETEAEVNTIKSQYGDTPVGHLHRLGLLDSQLIACHCVVLSPEDLELMAKAKVRVVHNPQSNLKLGSGIAPIAEILSRNIPLGLGTDGCASNNNLDLFEEMDHAAKLEKVNRLDPTLISAREALGMATWGGAEVLGFPRVGRLSPDWEADLIILDLQVPHLIPLYHPISQIVYAGKGSDVRDVMVHGQWLMKDRRILTLNVQEIMAQVKAIEKEIFNILFH